MGEGSGIQIKGALEFSPQLAYTLPMSPLEPLTQVPFSGSYAPEDVTFLLKPLELTPTPLAEKERHIQSGTKHYSEMLSLESAPSSAYLELFYDALERNGERLARDLHVLANLIERERDGDITLISLARGGTPIGILLRRELERRGLGTRRRTAHFSVSIIRDRGLDDRALTHLLEHGFHEKTWTFVDGWSAKGVIGRELGSSLEKFNLERGNLEHGKGAKPELFVVSDLFGGAAFSATRDDYLIPSSLLNATVSGLISRSVLSEQIGPDDFHGCVRLEHLRAHDLSRFFVDAVWAQMGAINPDTVAPPSAFLSAREFPARDFLTRLAFERHLPLNHLKPGIGESTRALLRRVPESLLLRDPCNPEVAHLVHLARDKGVTLETVPDLPCLALALIARLEPSES